MNEPKRPGDIPILMARRHRFNTHNSDVAKLLKAHGHRIQRLIVSRDPLLQVSQEMLAFLRRPMPALTRVDLVSDSLMARGQKIGEDLLVSYAQQLTRLSITACHLPFQALPPNNLRILNISSARSDLDMVPLFLSACPCLESLTIKVDPSQPPMEPELPDTTIVLNNLHTFTMTGMERYVREILSRIESQRLSRIEVQWLEPVGPGTPYDYILGFFRRKQAASSTTITLSRESIVVASQETVVTVKMNPLGPDDWDRLDSALVSIFPEHSPAPRLQTRDATINFGLLPGLTGRVGVQVHYLDV